MCTASERHPAPLEAAAFESAVVETLRSIVGGDGRPVALHEPLFRGREWQYVKECLDTGWVSTAGSFVERFESELAAYSGARYVVAVVNGTAALQVALQLVGVGSGEEVLVPALSFVATANAVAHCGAVPHFVDAEERTLGLDPAALARHLAAVTEIRSGTCVNVRTGRPIRVLVPMHTFGHPADLAGLQQVADDFHLVIVEDAAESLGSLYRGRHTGTFGATAALSFNGNKTITTGGGGAILTNDEQLAREARHVTTTARLADPWHIAHDRVAYNYRLPNLNAALGCAQLEQLPAFVEGQRRLFRRYREAFAKVPGVQIFAEPNDCRSNYWLQTLLLDSDRVSNREAVLAATNQAGLATRPVWTLLNRLPMYQNCPRSSLTVAEALEARIINLPSGAGHA
jgi:perosamine synthetase